MALNSLGVGFMIFAKDAASKVFAAVGRAMNGLGDKEKSLQQKAGELSTEMKRVGVAMMGVGLAGLAGLGLAANEAANFSKGISEASTLIDASKFSADEMRAVTMKMISAFGGNAEDQIKALYQGISAGTQSAAESTSLLTASNKLAVAGVTDVSTALDGLTNVLNAYGRAFTEQNLAETSDAFFVAVKSGKTKVGELAAVIGRLAPAANSVGISIDEMLASISAITTKGLKTEEAVTGLKAAIANIIHPSAKAAAEAARLGIKFDQATLRSKGWVKFLAEIQSSSKYNADTMSKLFESVEGFNAIQALVANNSKAFSEILGEMGKKAGGTERAFATMSESVAFQKQMFMGLSQQAVIMIGEALLPILNVVLKVANAFLRGFNAIPKPIKTVLVALFGVVSVVLVVVGAIIALTGVVIGLVAIGLKPLLIALGAALVLFSGIGAIAAVAALAAVGFRMAWERNLGGFRTFIMGAVEKIQLAFAAVQQLFESGQFSGAVLTDLNKAGNSGVKSFAITVFLWFNRIKNFVVGIGSGFGAVIDTMGPTFERLVAALRNLGLALGLVQDKPDEAKEKWQAFGEMGARVGRILGTVFDYIAKGIAAVVEVIGGMVEGFTALSPTFTVAQGAAANLFDAFASLLDAILGTDEATTGSGSSWAALGAVIGAVANIIVGAISMMVNTISIYVGMIAGIFGAVRAAVMGIVNTIGDLVSLVTDLLSGNWSAAWDDAKMIVYHFVEAVTGMLGALLGAILGTIDKIAKLFGADLGLKKGLEGLRRDLLKSTADGLGVKVTAPAVATATPVRQGTTTVEHVKPVAGPTAANAPAVAAQQAAQPRQGTTTVEHVKPAPINISLHNTTTLDGRVIADNVKELMGTEGARGFGPHPAAT